MSCNYNIEPNNNLSAEISDNKEIIGSWSIYSTSNQRLTYICNACPTVLFISDGTAFITNHSGGIEVFNWTLKKNVLTVSYINHTVNKTFSDTAYNIGFSEQKKLSELNIYTIKGDQTYFLNRRF